MALFFLFAHGSECRIALPHEDGSWVSVLWWCCGVSLALPSPINTLSPGPLPLLVVCVCVCVSRNQELARKREEKSRKIENRVASNNAAQRQNQNVRKPWVAHVNAELNNAAGKAAAEIATQAPALALAPTPTPAVGAAIAQPQLTAAGGAAAASPSAAPGVVGVVTTAAGVVGGAQPAVASTAAAQPAAPATA